MVVLRPKTIAPQPQARSKAEDGRLPLFCLALQSRQAAEKSECLPLQANDRGHAQHGRSSARPKPVEAAEGLVTIGSTERFGGDSSSHASEDDEQSCKDLCQR
jgi:hypothetical protein